MQFSVIGRMIIQNEIDEFKLNAYQIWKRHWQKKWTYRSVCRLVNHYRETWIMDRKRGSGRPRTARTEENEEMVEEQICSQEEPHTHQTPRQIEKSVEISRSTVRRIIDDKNINNFKRTKTPAMNDGTRQRQVERSGGLKEKFENNPRLIERCVRQDEKDFTVDVPVNHQNDRVYQKGKKSDIPPENLEQSTKKMSRKVMVSAGICYHGECCELSPSFAYPIVSSNREDFKKKKLGILSKWRLVPYI